MPSFDQLETAITTWARQATAQGKGLGKPMPAPHGCFIINLKVVGPAEVALELHRVLPGHPPVAELGDFLAHQTEDQLWRLFGWQEE